MKLSIRNWLCAKKKLRVMRPSITNPIVAPQTTHLLDIRSNAALPEIEVQHIEQTAENFLSGEECAQVMSELIGFPYTRERGRLTIAVVLNIGENYSYSMQSTIYKNVTQLFSIIKN